MLGSPTKYGRQQMKAIECKNKLTAEAQRTQREESEIFTIHLGLL